MCGRGDHSTKRWGQCACRYEKFIDVFFAKGKEIFESSITQRLKNVYPSVACQQSIYTLLDFVSHPYVYWKHLFFVCEGHIWWRNLTQKLYLFVGCHPHCVLCSCECVCFCMIEIFWRTNVFIGVKEYACIIIACKWEEEWKLVMFIYMFYLKIVYKCSGWSYVTAVEWLWPREFFSLGIVCYLSGGSRSVVPNTFCI